MKWLLVAACIALLQPLWSNEAHGARKIRCKFGRSIAGHPRGKWTLKTFSVVSPLYRNRWRTCRSLASTVRSGLSGMGRSRARVPYKRRLELHVSLTEVKMSGGIRFEARAWAVSAKGHHLRHAANAAAQSRASSRYRAKMAPKIAHMALHKALRELVSAVRGPSASVLLDPIAQSSLEPPE